MTFTYYLQKVTQYSPRFRTASKKVNLVGSSYADCEKQLESILSSGWEVSMCWYDWRKS